MAAKSAGEKKREQTLKKAKKVRDMLLTAQATIPGLVSEVGEIIENLEPTKEDDGGKE